MTDRQQRNPLIFFAAAAIIPAAVLVFEHAGFWSSFDARLRDKLIERRPAVSDIIIVAIDDKSIQELGVWPWPRSIHARLIKKLIDSGAARIGYDVTFSEASTPREDSALSDSVRDAGGKIVLASEMSLKLTDGLPEGRDPLLPIAALRTASGYGVTTLYPDRDGVVRLAPVTIRRDGADENSFAAALAQSASTVLEKGLYRIPFVGGPDSFRRFSAADVLSGRIPNDIFAGATVLVGSTAPDLHDEYLTPLGFGRYMPGVEIQANIIQGLRQSRALIEPSVAADAAILALLAALISLAAYRTRLRFALLTAALIALGYLVAALAAASRGVLLPVLYPLLVAAGTAAGDIAYRYAHEKGRRRFIQTAFSRYLAPQVIDKLVSGEAKLELGGVKTELTILFSDIRGFTSISEKLSPEALVGLLNEYLTAMTDIILETEGVVDKYIGDAIMAFWNAPMPQTDHAVRAARTA
ncbi:MAG: adenylate/guanylate cyclase domain-containing protein, partial [Patescibacteria group bacterium]